nr:unnamed protein product [Callosobruchus analis]
MTTLLVFDGMRKGFSCCFMIGNRFDEEIVTIAFMKIKEKLGRSINCQVRHGTILLQCMGPNHESSKIQVGNTTITT